MATRKDVAAYAGVSVATVSNVMNHSKPVSEEVRIRVEKAIADLDYHPNLLARSLATRQTRHVAFLVDNLKNPYYAEMLEGAQAFAAENGYIISIMMFDFSNKDNFIHLLSHGVDGVISTEIHKGVDEEVFKKYSIPVVRVDQVQINYRNAIEEAVVCLRNAGHKDIAYLAGIHDHEGYEHERLYDFIEAIEKGGLKNNADLIIEPNFAETTDESAGIEATERLINKNVAFSAIMAVNDLMAEGAIRCLYNHGIRVPEDVSIVGCDNVLQTSFAIPSISTIDVNSYLLGRYLMEALVLKLQGKEAEQRQIHAEFIRRESIGEYKG